MAVKLTKNELKVQKDRLKQFQRYLPTLQLKKQQLQSVVMQVTAQLEQVEQLFAAWPDYAGPPWRDWTTGWPFSRKTTASRRTSAWRP